MQIHAADNFCGVFICPHSSVDRVLASGAKDRRSSRRGDANERAVSCSQIGTIVSAGQPYFLSDVEYI